MLILLCYSTHDSDLHKTLSVLPDAINCLSWKSGLITKSITKLVVEGKLLFLRRCCCNRSWCFAGRLVARTTSCMKIIHIFAPCIMYAWFMVCIHSIMLFTTAVMITSAPVIVFSIDSNHVFLFNQAPCRNCVRTLFRMMISIWIEIGSRSGSNPFFICGLCCKISDLLIKFGLFLSTW